MEKFYIDFVKQLGKGIFCSSYSQVYLFGREEDNLMEFFYCVKEMIEISREATQCSDKELFKCKNNIDDKNIYKINIKNAKAGLNHTRIFNFEKYKCEYFDNNILYSNDEIYHIDIDDYFGSFSLTVEMNQFIALSVNQILVCIYISIRICKEIFADLFELDKKEVKSRIDYYINNFGQQDDFESKVLREYNNAMEFLFETKDTDTEVHKGMLPKNKNIPSISSNSSINTITISSDDKKSQESFTRFLSSILGFDIGSMQENDDIHYTTILPSSNNILEKNETKNSVIPDRNNKEDELITNIQDTVIQMSNIFETELKIAPYDYLRMKECIQEWINLSNKEKEMRTIYDYSFLDCADDLVMVIACIKNKDDHTIYCILNNNNHYKLWAIKGSVTDVVIHNLSCGCNQYPRFLVGDYKSGVAFSFNNKTINKDAPNEIIHLDALYLYMTACSILYKRYMNKVASENNIIIDNPSFSTILKTFESCKMFNNKKEIDLVINIIKDGKDSETCKQTNPFYKNPKNTLRVITPDFTDYRLIEDEGIFQYDVKKSASCFNLDSKFKIISIYGSITIPLCPYLLSDQFKQDMIKILNWIKVNFKGENTNDIFKEIDELRKERNKGSKRSNHRKKI